MKHFNKTVMNGFIRGPNPQGSDYFELCTHSNQF